MRLAPLIVNFALAATAAQALCCTQPSTSALGAQGSTVAFSEHFRLELSSSDLADSSLLRSTLEDNYARILADLQVDSLPRITVTFHASGSAFKSAVGLPNLPSWAVGMSTSAVAVHVVSPRSPDAGRPFEEMMKVVVHEFTHCVTLNMNPSFGNNPRWLWEGVALFEAGQFSHPSGLTGWPDELPSLASLNANWQTNADVYTGGYVMVEYIVDTWGKDKLVQLIGSNADIQGSLGVSTSAFEQGWWQFLRSKYGGP